MLDQLRTQSTEHGRLADRGIPIFRNRAYQLTVDDLLEDGVNLFSANAFAA